MYRLLMNILPGEIRVVAYDDNGNVVGEQTVRTAGKAARLSLDADRQAIAADGNDLAFITVSLCDADGTLIPDADNQLVFEVTGAGVFKAACNGDATSLEPFTMPTMHLFHGQLVLVVQASKQPGDIHVVVKDQKDKVMVAETTITVK